MYICAVRTSDTSWQRTQSFSILNTLCLLLFLTLMALPLQTRGGSNQNHILLYKVGYVVALVQRA